MGAESASPSTNEERLELLVTALRLSHDRRFVDCDDRDLTTTPDGDKTVIYCHTCRGVIAKPELGGGA